ncbi:hypothetical protein EYF80_014712 [Liparis tanakae]|uniref:Uncharacterized protein n=1 Tax=Liparis tanakae TaxID=230148 RepID=A0A4Z2IAH6_9TELE|nr:hypothetical protein EYF80_014712 [Liparis tanakae]
MSPTKSGARSRKRSLPIAHRLAPFMQNLSKSTFFRLNSFTVHVSHAATWFSVHCLGSMKMLTGVVGAGLIRTRAADGCTFGDAQPLLFLREAAEGGLQGL